MNSELACTEKGFPSCTEDGKVFDLDVRFDRHFVFIIGTRAQLIKVAPVIVGCEKRDLPCTLLMTGQHLETMQDLFDEFGIRTPRISALPAKEHATVGSLLWWLPKAYCGVVRMLKALDISPERVDILVHGDTLSTVIGAMAGRRFGGRVVHLESGLTSKNIFDPFPEEISRRIVFKMTHVAMCPNDVAVDHIRKKYGKCIAVNTLGNTILDSVSLVGIDKIERGENPEYLVVSLHRFQNIYDKKRLYDIVRMVDKISEMYKIYFVLHPATRRRLIKQNLLDSLGENKNINLSPRLGYGNFLRLAAGAACVLTDGGSNQEELAALGVPTVVMRDSTERHDGVGENAIMEKDVSSGVVDYIVKKKFSILRRGVTIKNGSPSDMVINWILCN